VLAYYVGRVVTLCREDSKMKIILDDNPVFDFCNPLFRGVLALKRYSIASGDYLQ